MSKANPKDRENTAKVISAFLVGQSLERAVLNGQPAESGRNWLGHDLKKATNAIDKLLIEGRTLQQLYAALGVDRRPSAVKDHLDHLWKPLNTPGNGAHNLPFKDRPVRDDPNGVWIFDRRALGVDEKPSPRPPIKSGIPMHAALKEVLIWLGGRATREQIAPALAQYPQKWEKSTLKKHLWACVVNNPRTYGVDASFPKILFDHKDGSFELYSESIHGPNVWRPVTPKAIDATEPPKRLKAEVNRILRDTELARRIKVSHKYKCQMCDCDYVLQLRDGSYYAEAHHIQPLGKPHNGLDVEGNILCLCPCHHAEVDFGAIKMDIRKLRMHPNHRVEKEYVDYHNWFYGWS